MYGLWFTILLVEVCVVVVADICFMLLFLRTAKLREGPGQLILVQAQGQIIVDLHWLIMFDPDIEENYNACMALAFVAYFGFIMSCTYAAAICVAVSVHFDKPKYPSLWLYHVAVLAISISISLIIYLTGGEKIEGFNFCRFNHVGINTNWTE